MRGDPAHPANRGKLCVKGNALGETVGLEDRLLYPQVRGERVTWDAAIATVAGEFRRLHPQRTARNPWRSTCPASC